MPSVLKLVDKASDATVLFDFMTTTGSGNPGTCKAFLMGDPDFGTIPSNFTFFESEDSPGGSLAKRRHGLTEMRFRFRPLATTADNLYTAIGTLGKYLDEPSNYALLIQLDGWAEKRYADIAGGLVPSVLRGQELALFHTLKRFEVPDGVEVVLWRQPYLRGPSVTVGPTTVQNDPADASGRFIEVTNAGNAAAPAAVKVQGDTGAKVQKVVVARKSVGPFASTRVTDYTGGTQYGQLNATGNGWTVTLFNDTTSVADGDASGGFAAQTTHATNPTVMQKRVRITRTANLDSLRGTSLLVPRIKNTAAARHIVQARWAHSLADPATFSETEIPHDTTGTATFAYEDKEDFGRMHVPKEHMLGGVAVEFWSRRESGSGNLMWDFNSFIPADESLSTISVPGSSKTTWLGSQLVTPVTNPAGGTAGVVVGTSFMFNDATDNVGTPPNTGLLFGTGRHRFTFRLSLGDAGGTDSWTMRIRNITDSTDVVSKVYTHDPDEFESVHSLEFDLPSGAHATSDFYQAQVDDPTGNVDEMGVISITHEFLPAIASGEEAHSDPERQLLHKMDASDNIMLPLTVEGSLPIWLAPGLNALYLHYVDVPVVSGAPGGNSVLTRDCAVTIQFAPRYLS